MAASRGRLVGRACSLQRSRRVPPDLIEGARAHESTACARHLSQQLFPTTPTQSGNNPCTFGMPSRYRYQSRVKPRGQGLHVLSGGRARAAGTVEGRFITRNTRPVRSKQVPDRSLRQVKHGHSANLNPRLMLTDLHPFITYVRQLLFECVRMHAKARCALGSRRVLTT